jgi:hypothetical protein
MLQQSPQQFCAQPPEWFAKVEPVHLAWLLFQAAHLLVAIVAIRHQGSATLDQVHLARISFMSTRKADALMVKQRTNVSLNAVDAIDQGFPILHC